MEVFQLDHHMYYLYIIYRILIRLYLKQNIPRNGYKYLNTRLIVINLQLDLMIIIYIYMRFKEIIINKLQYVEVMILLLQILIGQLMGDIFKVIVELLNIYFFKLKVGNYYVMEPMF
jgi:hypothetical protein